MSKTWARETFDRAWKTAVQFFLASVPLQALLDGLMGGQLNWDVKAWGVLALMVVGAFLSVIFSALGKLFGDGSPMILPASRVPESTRGPSAV